MAREPLTRHDGMNMLQKAWNDKLEQKYQPQFFKPHPKEAKKEPVLKFTPNKK